MQEHTKKRPTEGVEVIVRHAGKTWRFMGTPACRSKVLDSIQAVRGVRAASGPDDGDSIPWREVPAIKAKLETYGAPATALKGARLKEDMTQKELAEAIGVAQHHISQMEHGKRPIGKAMARRLSKVLNIDYRVFL